MCYNCVLADGRKRKVLDSRSKEANIVKRGFGPKGRRSVSRRVTDKKQNQEGL